MFIIVVFISIELVYVVYLPKEGIPLQVFPEIMSGSVTKLFSSNVTTIKMGYPLTFRQLSGYIIIVKGVSHYNFFFEDSKYL